MQLLKDKNMTTKQHIQIEEIKKEENNINIKMSFNSYLKFLYKTKELEANFIIEYAIKGKDVTYEMIRSEIETLLSKLHFESINLIKEEIICTIKNSSEETDKILKNNKIGLSTLVYLMRLNNFDFAGYDRTIKEKKEKGRVSIKYSKTELSTPILKNALSSFYFSSLFLTKNAIEKMPNIKNYELIKKHPTALFLKDLKQYEFLVFLYAANVFRTGTKTIEYNPTEIKNYFGIEHHEANQYIKNAFESILTKEVILYSLDKNYLMVGKLVSSTMYKIEGDQKIKYNLNADLIQYFTNDEIISNYIKLSSIDLKTFAKLSPLERNYMLALLYVGQRAKKAYTKTYKDFILSFQGVGTQNENKSAGAVRKQFSDSKKKLIKVLEIIQNKKAYYIKIEAKTFSIRIHKSRKIINSKVKEIDKK